MAELNIADGDIPNSGKWDDIDEQLVVQSTSFPTNVAGRICARTDVNRLFIADGTTWNELGGFDWVDFTPSWTNLTIGSGAAEIWKYCYTVGGMWVTGTTQLGTSPSVSGTVSMTIPNSETTTAISQGTALYVDASTPYSATVQANSTSITFFAGTSGYFTTGSPFTVASGDDVRATIFVALT